VQFAKCEFDKCEKKEICERFTKAKGAVVNFKVICLDYDYKWYVPDEEKIKELESKSELIETNYVDKDETKSEDKNKDLQGDSGDESESKDNKEE
jgi:hypothetical protein